jgi:hypothetical protein
MTIMRLATLLTLICTSGACACTIPVFRYALDRWEADKFHLVLPASVAQDATMQDLLRPLRANGKANLDISSSSDPATTVAELRSSRNSDQLVWSGALDKNSLDALLESPVRQKIVEHILAGDSVVWIIADSGSPLDTTKAEHIEKRLRFLEQVAALPVQDPNDPDSQLGPGPALKLKFTVLRIRMGDPSEQPLLRMLTGPGERDRLQCDQLRSRSLWSGQGVGGMAAGCSGRCRTRRCQHVPGRSLRLPDEE